MARRNRFFTPEAPDPAAMVGPVRELARPLHKPGDLDPLLERIGDAHFVLLGEASHGTSEYYNWRAAPTPGTFGTAT
jgi:erythromycin esterase-like protein